MENLFDQLSVGDELETRETKYAPWIVVEVTEKEGDSITMQNDDIGEIHTDKEETNDPDFFRSIH